MWEECGKIEAVLCRGIAQLVEHRSPKPGVGGSSPSAPAIFYCNLMILLGRLRPRKVKA